MRNIRHLVICLAATSLVAGVTGCRNPEPADDTAAPVRATAVFEGKADPDYVGNWKTQDGNSELDLEKDGTAAILATVQGPGKKIVNHLVGDWALDNGNLLLRYSQNGAEVVLKYAVSLKGDVLMVTEPPNKKPTEYRKSK